MAYKIYYHHLIADLWTSCNDFWTSCNAFTIAIALYSSILWPWVICNKVSTALYTFVCVFKTIRVSNGCNQSVWIDRARNSDSKSAKKVESDPWNRFKAKIAIRYSQGHRTGYKKIRGTSSPAFFGLRGTVPGTKSSGALWILITLPNLGNGRETQNIGWVMMRWWLHCNLLPSLRRSNQRTFEGQGASWSTNRSAIWEIMMTTNGAMAVLCDIFSSLRY